MPCLNEARTVGACVKKARDYLDLHSIKGEVIVADNGSTDGSQAIAAGLGARVAPVASPVLPRADSFCIRHVPHGT
jgi:glycosyltransferase involved in cell wall biosynthesis